MCEDLEARGRKEMDPGKSEGRSQWEPVEEVVKGPLVLGGPELGSPGGAAGEAPSGRQTKVQTLSLSGKKTSQTGRFLPAGESRGE